MKESFWYHASKLCFSYTIRAGLYPVTIVFGKILTWEQKVLIIVFQVRDFYYVKTVNFGSKYI